LVNLRNKLSNCLASIICYVLIPFFPLVSEYLYSQNHIALRTIVITVSSFSFGLAFTTKFRIMFILMIVNGLLFSNYYGTVKSEQIGTFSCGPAIILYIISAISMLEWCWRHFYENETCWVYSIFQKS
jgi:hypothetical protein